jgi:hypothetical protein
VSPSGIRVCLGDPRDIRGDWYGRRSGWRAYDRGEEDGVENAEEADMESFGMARLTPAPTATLEPHGRRCGDGAGDRCGEGISVVVMVLAETLLVRRVVPRGRGQGMNMYGWRARCVANVWPRDVSLGIDAEVNPARID